MHLGGISRAAKLYIRHLEEGTRWHRKNDGWQWWFLASFCGEPAAGFPASLFSLCASRDSASSWRARGVAVGSIFFGAATGYLRMADANREIAKRMLQYRQHFDGEIKKAADLEAQAQTIRQRICAQSARVAQGLPSPDACPDCWVQRGKTVTVLPHVSQGHDKFDRWACSSCGWHFDILAR